ncbi:MAG: DUF4833 domain-containing protein [Bacteroidota bacterium]
MNKLRNDLQKAIYLVIDPFVRLLVRLGFTPNTVTVIGFLLNIGVAVIFIVGAEQGHRGDLSYVGWAGALVLFAGLFDMLDGQVARIGKMSSSFGAFFDSVLDRYSELVMFLGICYYLVSHHYFLSSLFAFMALIGSMMVSYTRARAEGLHIENKGGLMQRPERVVLVALSAIACGITGHYAGGDYKLYIEGIPFGVFETMSVFTIPLTIMAILTNYTAYKRITEAKKALDAKDALEAEAALVAASVSNAAGQKAVTTHIGLKQKAAVFALLLPALLFISPVSNAQDVVDTFPVPNEVEKLMFYIQRTNNSNTICYQLNTDQLGTPDADNPIKIFWLRYADENGKRRDLNFIQRKFAYGLKVKKDGNNYELRSVAYPKKQLFLRKGEDGAYHVFAGIGNREAILNRIYIKIDGGTFWHPNVKYIELKGKNPVTGNTLIERIQV